MRRSSGNLGGSFDGMRDVNDSHRTLDQLIGAARSTFDDGLTGHEQAGLVRFEQAVARRTLRSTSRFGAWSLALVAAGATAAVVLYHRTDSTLTFAVVNGSVSDGGYVRAKAEGGTELQFSDGSSLALDPGTSTRVTDIDAHGSRVLLESGRAHVRVTHKPAAKWTIDAGPYSVQVVGTEFDVRWSGSEEVLDVQMQRGKVIVRGPLAAGGGLTMEAGQHLVASVKDGDLFLDATPGAPEASNLPRRREESPEPTFVDDPATAPSIAAPATAPAHAARARALAVRNVAAPAVAGDVSWSKLIAQGEFEAVLANAEQRGLARTFESASAADLTALADAARYVRRSDVARRALLAERDRFSQTGPAREAAFFLGGLAEDESGVGAAKTALEWYERYLSESPRGTYAAQALGRRMILVHKLRGSAAARPIASEYLERFPSGAYAEPAKKLLRD